MAEREKRSFFLPGLSLGVIICLVLFLCFAEVFECDPNAPKLGPHAHSAYSPDGRTKLVWACRDCGQDWKVTGLEKLLGREDGVPPSDATEVDSTPE